MSTRFSPKKLNPSASDTNTGADTDVIQHATTDNPTYRRIFISAMVIMTLCAYLFVEAVLPLYGLWFHTASLGLWSAFPTHLLFPGWQLTPTLLGSSNGFAPPFALSWETTALLLLSFGLVFLCYLVALRFLPERVGMAYIIVSTALLGLMLIFAPVVTSQDIYSYIIYARMLTLYHLNPLITSPMSIMTDPTFAHLYWTNQPSAYGPTWILLTSALQWLTSIFGTPSISSLTSMILSLRTLGLLAHLGSTLLLWSISGRLQQKYGSIHLRARVVAILAFAWNPLVLFEASVNAHNDAMLLFLVLLALWCLTRWTGRPGYVLAACVFALATCLKVNVVLLVPGLVLYIWSQPGPTQARLRESALMLSLYIVMILVLYAPFWSHGGILLIIHVNPGTSRATNSLAEFFSHLYNSLFTHSTQESGYPAEVVSRYASEGLFVIGYLALCWYGLRRRISRGVMNDTRMPSHHAAEGVMNDTPTDTTHMTEIGMIRWMGMAWLLYCVPGSPWFWPWYLVTFFGFFALLEALPDEEHSRARLASATRVLAFCMLSLYCFYAWSPYGSFVPFLVHFRWAYLRGLWAWLPFLLLLLLLRKPTSVRREEHQTKKYHTLSRDIVDS